MTELTVLTKICEHCKVKHNMLGQFCSQECFELYHIELHKKYIMNMSQEVFMSEILNEQRELKREAEYANARRSINRIPILSIQRRTRHT